MVSFKRLICVALFAALVISSVQGTHEEESIIETSGPILQQEEILVQPGEESAYDVTEDVYDGYSEGELEGDPEAYQAPIPPQPFYQPTLLPDFGYPPPLPYNGAPLPPLPPQPYQPPMNAGYAPQLVTPLQPLPPPPSLQVQPPPPPPQPLPPPVQLPPPAPLPPAPQPLPIPLPSPALYQKNYSVPIAIQTQYQVRPELKPLLGPVATYEQKLPAYKGPQQVYQAQPANYTGVQLQSYLTSMVPFTGYLGNHWSLLYYTSSPYRSCPKNVYLSGPSYKDIDAAFNFARTQLEQTRNLGYGYFNSTQTNLNVVNNVLNQLNARMDEEGLLMELVSLYLAERACLTKWDKQRYLPQLTKLVTTTQFPGTHSCSNYYKNQWQANAKTCAQNKYRTYDGFCNNPYHPYWGKSNVCHIRLLSPDYADGISAPRNSYNPRIPLPNPRTVSTHIHNDVPLESPYNMMKMQWGQFINHDITNTAQSAYDGLVDCCKNPKIRGCLPIYVQGDRFYGSYNVTCLNFIRSTACPTCQLGPRQQLNKNTAFLDGSLIYGSTQEQAMQLRSFVGGKLRVSYGKNGETLLPLVNKGQESFCFGGACYQAGDMRCNQHPALTALHTLLLRNHNIHATQLAYRHPNWNDEYLFQEARRLNIAEIQMITYNEYLPVVFGPILSAYYKLVPLRGPNYTYYDPKVDPTTWNEYSTASCRFGHSQISSVFGLYKSIYGHAQQVGPKDSTYRLKEWFHRTNFLGDGLIPEMINGLLSRTSHAVDPWVATDVHNHLNQDIKLPTGGDLPATNIWRGREHGIPGYIHYIDYCFNIKIKSWKDLSLFIPYYTLNQMRKIYKVPENIDLFTGGLSERHFPGADTGPTFACINGIQYYHLKFGDRFYFEHGNQAGSFTPPQLEEIKRATLSKLLCRTAYLQVAPQYAFLQPSVYNPLVNCSHLGGFDYSKF